MCAGRNALLRTSDGGRNWSVLNTNLSKPNTEIARVWFRDERLGWAGGAVSHKPTIWRTTDGGGTWSLVYQWPRDYPDALGAILDIQFVDQMHGWAVGFNGLKAMIVATADGGQRWTVQYVGAEITWQFKRVLFSDCRNGWVLSPDAIMLTEDGGESWGLRYFDSGLLNDLEVVKPSEVWAAGGWGHLLHTRDGVGWEQVPLAPEANGGFCGWVKFASPNVGWASGVKGEVWETRNAGKTWNRSASLLPMLPPDTDTGEMVLTATEAFIIANPGTLLIHSIVRYGARPGLPVPWSPRLRLPDPPMIKLWNLL